VTLNQLNFVIFFIIKIINNHKKMNNFFSQPYTPQFDFKQDLSKKQHGMRSSAVADFRATEVCMSKCNMKFDSSSVSDGESNCLRQCFVKFFDSGLIIDNEMQNFTRGVNM